MSQIQRPAIRYHGGKFALSNWIISHFPSHISYCEPFCGGANILLRKPRVLIETINDLDDEVVNFFEVLVSNTEGLIHRIQYTPYSRRIWERAWENKGNTPVQKALDFYIRSWMTFGSGQGQKSGWRYMKRDSSNIPATDWTKTEHLWQVAERLRGVQIECRDAFDVIRQYDTPDTLFYIDPPYLMSTRFDKRHDYRHELDNAKHEELAGLLQSVKGMVVLSGYESDLYNDLYAGWQTRQKISPVNNGAKSKTEKLWLSPSILHQQLSLI